MHRWYVAWAQQSLLINREMISLEWAIRSIFISELAVGESNQITIDGSSWMNLIPERTASWRDCIVDIVARIGICNALHGACCVAYWFVCSINKRCWLVSETLTCWVLELLRLFFFSFPFFFPLLCFCYASGRARGICMRQSHKSHENVMLMWATVWLVTRGGKNVERRLNWGT